ncbi:unnamed protein product [marine sediment metagenome]|uniref:Uncharacterized protein n=1 Tax=marine sediment metagenome TaxID=412755 RepID=X0VL12_9ZZZZ
MAKQQSYEEIRTEFRGNPSAANKKKFLDARVKHIVQRQQEEKAAKKKVSTPKKKAAKK